MRAALLVLILAAPGPGSAVSMTPQGPAEADEAPEIRAIEASGSTVYDHDAILRIIRLRPGSRLDPDASAVAASLEARYRILGFPAARVEGTFDPATGTLTLRIDEGRLASVDVADLAGAALARVLDALDLRPGTILKDADVAGALRRLDDVSQGAFETVGDPPYSLERRTDGVRLTLHLRRRMAELGLGRGGTGRASLFNRVDGLSPGLRARLLVFDPSLDPLEAYAHVSYGFAAETPRFALGSRKSFGGNRAFTLGYEFHDLTDTDDTFRGWGVEKPRGRMVFFSIFEDYYRRHGHEAYAFGRISPRIHLGINWRSDRHASLPLEADGSFFFDKAPPPNPPVEEGLMRSLLATVRFASREDLFEDPLAEGESFLVRNPYGTRFERSQAVRGEASFEVADKALGGEFSFRRFIAHLRASRHLSPRQVVTGRVLLGLGGGAVPVQKRFALGGFGTLRGRRSKELTGDNMTLTTLEYAFEPGSPYPGIAVFYDGGAAWSRGVEGRGWLSDVGVGLTWPGGESRLVRIDVAVPVNAGGTARRARVTASLLIPFF